MVLLLKPHPVFAESNYVLPYPSAMPGSIWYKLDLIKEKLNKFLYFGDFSQFKYNLAEADKYLVEAKTLFEYKQYLLGYNALLKSNEYFKKINPTLISAKNHGKNISAKEKILQSASEKHIEVLTELKNILPKSFQWTPEKAPATNLSLWETVDKSIAIRKSLK